MDIIAYYSIANKDLTLYNGNTGACIAIVPCTDIYEDMRKYGIKESNLYISF